MLKSKITLKRQLSTLEKINSNLIKEAFPNNLFITGIMEKIICTAYLNGFLQWDENQNTKIEHSLGYTFSYSSHVGSTY